MNRKFLVLLLLLVMSLAACGRAQYAMEAPAAARDDYAYSEASAPMEAVAFNGGTVDTGDITSQTDAIPAAQTQERLIIRTGNLSIVVSDTEATMAQISEIVEANGGWVVSSSLYQYSETAKTGDITVRVPSDGYNSALEAIKGMALEVTNESSSGQDVTDEYVDLSSRLANLEATADRVRTFLDESQNVEEALAVNQELSRLEGDIEVIKGRMQYLSQSASFSTISVHLTPDEASQPIEVAGWRPQGVAKNAVEALVDALQGIANFAIWFVIFILPVLLIIGTPIWLVIRFFVRRRRRRKAAAVSPPVSPTE
ncbi:MAG: DUF4349 domain-containing protein [Ardenticatenaceae bacterium]|nr:DUF4349 domain-containing protein [Ardenticatenaceae bacterium]